MNNNKIPYGYIYKITNKLNGKIYIGLHVLKNEPWRKYLGSSLLLKADIIEYGADNFIKSLEEYCYSKEQLAAREIIIMNDYKKKNYAMYNGNFGSPVFPFHDTYNHMDNVRKKEIFKKISATRKSNLRTKYNLIFEEHGEEIIKAYKEHQHMRRVGIMFDVPYKWLREFLIDNNIELNSQNTIGTTMPDEKRKSIQNGLNKYVKNNNIIKFISITRNCNYCGNEFITEQNKQTGEYKGLYCSISCSNKQYGKVNHLTKEDIEYLYNVEKLSTKEIAIKYNCSASAVYKAAKRLEVLR